MTEPFPKVLFIDDDNGKRYVLSRAMRNAGFDVDEAATGAQGLSKLSPEVDLIVLDIKLPDMTGWDIAAKVKTTPALSTVMILELSATLATAEDRAKGLDRGADAYLVHPVEVVELLAVMRALVRLRRSERERERQRELFLATVGHDLRNPLETLSTGAAVLASADMAERERKAVERMQRATQRMKRLLDQLLVFTQGAAGGVTVASAPNDLAAICRNVIGDLESPDREIRIADRLGEPVSCDGARVTQLVENLVTNALKHGDGMIDIALSRDDRFALLAVHNGGDPIPPEAVPTLFDPYRRAKSRAGGLGLGLFIVDQIVRAHGGSVTVSSTQEHGTTFEVRLPIGR
jgi:signal transduction histidine kinase|nr:hybrid sensor histidine kinase/response regulator [Kofleriaceae bacterium]